MPSSESCCVPWSIIDELLEVVYATLLEIAIPSRWLPLLAGIADSDIFEMGKAKAWAAKPYTR